MQIRSNVFSGLSATVAAIAVLGLMTGTAFGAPVSFERAQNTARKHLERTRGGKIKPASALQALSSFSMAPQTSATAPYFVFEKENDGFIIVAADDIAVPILGETDKGNFDKENLPPALLWLLGTYETQIEEAVLNGAKQDEETKQLWEQATQSLSLDMAASYPEKLLTTTWDQSTPYNNQCPMDGGTRSVTGCVATAMAQIMKYWSHPAYGTGESAAYNTKTKNISVPSVNFNTYYDYGNMLDSYTSNGGTEIQRDAVATLMYHAGVSVQMDYSASESGALASDAARALTQYFGYDNIIRYIYSPNSSGISASDWKDLVIGQIENNSPVYYRGQGTAGGHAFIIDGYDNSDGRFHLNWGWGGYQDGFYALTALNPDIYQFNNMQGMIINIMPDQGGNPPSQIKVTNFEVSKTQIAVSADITAKMNYGADFSGQIGFAVMEGNTVIMVLDSADYSISNTYTASSGRYTVNYSNAALRRQFGAGMPSGDLTLRTVTKRGAGAWTPVGETREISISEEDNSDITVARWLIENAAYTARQSDVSDIVQAKAAVEAILDGFFLNGVAATVIDGEFTPAIRGTVGNLSGADGSYTFTVKLNKDTEAEQTTTTLTLIIIATAVIDLSDANPAQSGDGWTFTNNIYNISDSGAYVIFTGSNEGSQRRVTVAANAKNVRISLEDVTIGGLGSNQSPLLLNSGADVTLTLVGTNTLTAGSGRAGIQAPQGTALEINGTGSLTVTGGSGGAGIGGGISGTGGDITITGGVVTATGGSSGQGIGRGSGSGSAGTFTMDSNAVVFTNSVGDTATSRRTGGILFIGSNAGIFYGESVTITQDITIPAGRALTVPTSRTLTIADGVTFTNNGTVTPANGSAIIINGTVDGANRIVGANVSVPELNGRTEESITIYAANLLAATEQEIEYAISVTNAPPASGWQTDAVFDGLVPSGYYIFARSKGNDNFAAGTASAALHIKPITYTVTYNLNGGENHISNPATYDFTSSNVMLNTPTRTYYTFGGWYEDFEFTGTSVTTIPTGSRGNKEYWAKWAPINYTISYTLNGGTVSLVNPTSYNIETETFTLNNPVRTGYTFIGWTGDNGTEPDTTVSVEKGNTGDRSYTANWVPVTYTITYNLNGGENDSSNPSTYSITSSRITLQIPTRIGDTFDGWYEESVFTGTAVASIPTGSTGDKEYWAKWTPTNYTISYFLNGGTVSSANPATYNIETETFALNSPARAGYTFTGWTWSGQTAPQAAVTIEKGSTGNRSFTANWGQLTSVSSPDRATPVTLSEEAVVAAPINSLTDGFTVGPNIISKAFGNVVKIYRVGAAIGRPRSANDNVLTVYDATGNIVNKITVSNNAPTSTSSQPSPADARRAVGEWDLRDAKGRAVPEGTYLLRGAVRAVDGKRERVSLKVSVR